MSLIDKAKEFSGQAVEQAIEKVEDRGGDDLMGVITEVSRKSTLVLQL